MAKLNVSEMFKAESLLYIAPEKNQNLKENQKSKTRISESFYGQFIANKKENILPFYEKKINYECKFFVSKVKKVFKKY